MPIRRSVGVLLQRVVGANKAQLLDVVSQRVFQIFQDHGVEVSQIPRLFPLLKFSDLQSSEKLLAVLTPEILDQIARLFGIRTQWLEGVDDQLYEYLACNKRPETILGHLAALQNGKEIGLSFPLRILCTTKKLDRNSDKRQVLVPVLVEKIADLGGEEIYRYHIYRDGFDWDYFPARIELKAIARIVFKRLGTPVPLFVIGEKDMEDLLEGRLIPKAYLTGCLITNPSLEDYALTLKESVVAKEIDELPEVLRYIEEQNLQNFSFRQIDSSPSQLAVTKVVTSEFGDWREAARYIADEFHKKDLKGGAYGSVRNMADRVADEMRKRNIFGPRGPLSGGSVLRDALQGGKWKRNPLVENVGNSGGG